MIEAATQKKQNLRWRWRVLATLFFVTFINYLDRQTLGCAIEPISREFGLDNKSIGNLLAAFVFTYALSHLFVGFIIDTIKNIRLFFIWMVISWSICTILIGFVNTFEHILWLRRALGVFEAVNFPICLMIIARIFPAKERTLASGIFASGAFFATLLAPKFTIFFATQYSWRYAFIVAGVFGLLWIIPWLLIYRNQEKEPAVVSGTISWISTFTAIVRKPAFWGVMAIGIGIVPCLYFCTQWLPSYFTQGLGQAYNQALGNKLTIIYLFQDMGMWTSGALVFLFTGRGLSILCSRKIVMAIGYLMMVSVLTLSFISSVWMTTVVFSIFIFGLGICLSNQHAFKQDVLPGHVAAVVALVGFCETFFTSMVLSHIGILTEGGNGYLPIIWILASCATFSILSAYAFLRKRWISIE